MKPSHHKSLLSHLDNEQPPILGLQATRRDSDATSATQKTKLAVGCYLRLPSYNLTNCRKRVTTAPVSEALESTGDHINGKLSYEENLIEDGITLNEDNFARSLRSAVTAHACTSAGSTASSSSIATVATIVGNNPGDASVMAVSTGNEDEAAPRDQGRSRTRRKKRCRRTKTLGAGSEV